MEKTGQYKKVLRKLVMVGSKLPINQASFGAVKAEVARENLTPKPKTEEYSIGIYRTPVSMEKVTAFGSQNLAPAHQGGIQWAVDFYISEGAPIRAPASGRIIKTVERFDVHGTTAKYWLKGNGISIRCTNGERVWMEHLQYGFATKLGIKVGQKVRAGEIIGIIGNTGFSENPHVHMEVLKFIGNQKSKISRENYKNYITKKIRFDSRDVPFDLYVKEKESVAQRQQ